MMAKEKQMDLPGIGFEKVATRIQQQLDPGSVVTHNERLKDRIGNSRQCDGVIRGHFANRPVLGIMECRDHKRRLGPNAVEAFAKKVENLRANLGMMVSRKGYTKQALELAKHEGIVCVSLVNDAIENLTVRLGDYWFARFSTWTDVRLILRHATPQVLLPPCNPAEILFEGKPIIGWLMKHLFDELLGETPEGDYQLELIFPKPIHLQVGSRKFEIAAITCEAECVHRKKRRWISWTGDGFYDWNRGAATFSGGTAILSTPIDMNPSSWSDYDGPLPMKGDDMPGCCFQVIMDAVQIWGFDDSDDVADLEKLHPAINFRAIVPS